MPELVVLAVDNPPGRNGGYYSVGWRLDVVAGRGMAGLEPIPDWRFWKGTLLAVARLGHPPGCRTCGA